jgi:Dipeptidase
LKFRSIAMDRNQISSALQIRNDVDEKHAAVQWIALGFFAYSAYVPFFTNISDTPEEYKNTTNDVDVNNMYWLEKTMSVLVEPHFHEFSDMINAYRDDCKVYARQRIIASDKEADKASDVTEYLTKSNEETAGEIYHRTYKLFDDLVKKGLMLSRTTWEKGQNL